MYSKVYIPHLPTRQNPVNGEWVPTIDLSPAAELGDIEIVCNHPTDAAPENWAAARQRLQDALVACARDDYIVMAGDPVLCAYAIHLALGCTGKARVLRWNRDARQYDLLTIQETDHDF